MLYYGDGVVKGNCVRRNTPMLWRHWWNVVRQLRGACARERTFLWMVLCLAGMTVRTDLMGVTSLVRGLGL